MIKVIAFDLDGTLANTSNLATSQQSIRRVPELVLASSPPSTLDSPLTLDKELTYKIDLFISCGIKVFILTRAPKAYASTLLYMLRIPFHECIPASNEFRDTAEKLRYIRERSQILPNEMLYVGDSEDDRIAANGICLFQHIDSILDENGNSVSVFQNLVDFCDQAMDFHKTSQSISPEANHYRKLAWMREAKFEEHISMNVGTLLEKKNHDENIDSNHEVLLNDWRQDEFSFKPVVNPSFLTVTQYESDRLKKQKLFQFLINAGFGPKKIGAPDEFKSELPQGLNLTITACKYYWEKTDFDIQVLWQKIKDWQQIRGSGTEPQLHYLEFVALCMSAGLSNASHLGVLVPVPSNGFSVQKPAQASIRLTERISQLTGLPVVEALHRIGDDMKPGVGMGIIVHPRIALIDDQLTTGKTILKSINALYEIGIRNIDVYCFTHSKTFLKVKE